MLVENGLNYLQHHHHHHQQQQQQGQEDQKEGDVKDDEARRRSNGEFKVPRLWEPSEEGLCIHEV
jgi:hypothetical protein